METLRKLRISSRLQLADASRRGRDALPILPAEQHDRHLIDASAIEQMKRGVMVVNTSRGGLVDTRALIDGLKAGKIGSAGLDVYEEEAGIFFHNMSDTTLANIEEFASGKRDAELTNFVTITLVEMMVAIGLRVTFAELLVVARNWGLVARGMLANYVCVPAATVALLLVFDAHPMVAIGFVIPLPSTFP